MSNVILIATFLFALIHGVLGNEEAYASYSAAVAVMAYVDYKIKERDNAPS